MIYDITLKFSYDYPSAVKDARHILRVRPREDGGQSIAAQSLRLDPKPDEVASDRDFFGNGIDHVLLHHPHDALSIEMRARVRVDAPSRDLEATGSLAGIRGAAFRVRNAGALSPVHFLGSSRLVRKSGPIGAYAAKGMKTERASGFGAEILVLTKLIRKDFAYAPGTTRIDTPAEDVFENRKGVCQDFAHLMIAGLRGIGMPAAYVSGFLRTEPPPGKPRLEGTDAMHAWVKVWLGDETGWVGFDPTNGVATGADHIEVAIGRDYADVAPIGGVLVTSGPQKARHSVDVVPIVAAD